MGIRRFLIAGIFLYLLAATVYINLEARGRLSDIWHSTGYDFKVFYEAGESIIGQGRPVLFDREEEFRNPPVYAALYAPLTLLSLGDASRLHIIINVIAAVILAGVTRFWGASRIEQAAIFLALASYSPLVDSLIWGQPAPALALLMALALLLSERRPNSPISWLVTAALVLKPTLLSVPIGLFGARRAWRPLIGTSVLTALLLLVPFLVIGLDEVGEFIWQARYITKDAFTSEADVTAPAATLFNWNGVVARLWREQPPPAFVIVADAVTLALAYKAARRGSFREGWLAATAAMLLVTPHVHFHQWLVIFGPAIALYLERRSLATLGVLLLYHFAIVLTIVFWGDGVASGGWAAGLLCLLLYLAFRDRFDALFDVWLGRLRLQTRELAPEAPA